VQVSANDPSSAFSSAAFSNLPTRSIWTALEGGADAELAQLPGKILPVTELV